MAAAVPGAHVWTAVSDVEVIQSPGLLLVKGSLLEPAEPRGRRPEAGRLRAATRFFLGLQPDLFCLAVFGFFFGREQQQHPPPTKCFVFLTHEVLTLRMMGWGG